MEGILLSNVSNSHIGPVAHINTCHNEYTFTPHHSSSVLKRKNNFHKINSKKTRTEDNVIETTIAPSVQKRDRLSRSIWKLFHANKQTTNIYEKKMSLRDKLHDILLHPYPTCGLYVVGSSMTGLGQSSSDMDMCLMLTDNEIDQEKQAVEILETIQSEFLTYGFLKNVQVIHAKVPILRFTDSVSGIEVDLNVNNSVGIRNTQLLKSYARIDQRLPPLVLLIKMWARHKEINDAKNHSLSSYSLALMVIHYLQYRCRPPVLPCLQNLQRDKYQPHSPIRTLKLTEELPHFTSENEEDLGDLFLGFLNYFAHEFDFRGSVMSVRLGDVIPKEVAMNNTISPKNKKAHWKFVCIEEPFEMTNTACAVFNVPVFNSIKDAFVNSWNELRKSKDIRRIMNISY